MMLKRLKKIPLYLLKYLKVGNFKELRELYQQVEASIFFNALAARLDRRFFLANLKEFGPQEINTYLDLLPYRQARLEEDLFEWHIQGKRLVASVTQFLGLREEYLKNVFDSHYHYDWQGKCVLDVGGFVGDSALYFLEKQAAQVVVYEPLPKNIKALTYNLKYYQTQVKIHQKAITKKEGWITLSSREPIGSLGFGMQEGEYKIDCEGITFEKILLSHSFDVAKIDCEGAEKYLSDVDEKLIRSIPYWIVETHHQDIYQSIVESFTKKGFRKKIEFNLLKDVVDLIHFEKIS